MLSVVSWKWKPKGPYRSEFKSEHVNVLRRMVARNLRAEHEFVCVTDDPVGLDPEVRVVPLWDDHRDIPSAHGPGNPSCYRRLKAFSSEAKEIFGERILSIDLDCVITGDITHLVERDEDFVIWGDTQPGTPYNGGLWLLRTGTRTRVWDQFDPRVSPRKGKALGYVGSDQAWIAACLGKGEARYTRSDGVYSYRNEITKLGHLPATARIVMFHGKHDPWMADVQSRHSWIKEYWR